MTQRGQIPLLQRPLGRRGRGADRLSKRIRGAPDPRGRVRVGRRGNRGEPEQSLGHVAVVSKVLNSREIVVDHANWLNERAIHRDTPVRDVSKNNDWSAVRVWYTPGKQYGAGVYPSHGFIYPEQPKRFTTIANVNVRNAPSTYANRAMTLPRNSEIEVVEEVRDALWYRVAQHGRVLGYVYAELVEPLDDRKRRSDSPSREARATPLPPS
jgi:hypothetical protein